MRTKEVCKLTGLTQKSLRLYEQQGLICPASEQRNGRIYRDYTEEDVQTLRHIATLRKARFTMAEIRMMQEQPELVPAIYTNYLKRIQAEAAELEQLCRVASCILPETLGDYTAVAGAIAEGADPLPLPIRDIQPHFGKLDPESPEERAAEFAAYEQRQSRRWLRRLSSVAVLLAVFAGVTFVAAYASRAMDTSALSGIMEEDWPKEIDDQPDMMAFLHLPFSFSTSRNMFTEGAGILLDADGQIVMTAEPFFDLYGETFVPIPDDAALWEVLDAYADNSADTGMRAANKIYLAYSGELEDDVLTLTGLYRAEFNENNISDGEQYNYYLLWGTDSGSTFLGRRAGELYLMSSQDWLYLLYTQEPASQSRTGPIWDTITQYRGSVTYMEEQYEVVFFGHCNYLSAILHDYWFYYVIALLFCCILLFSRRFMTGDKSFIVTRQFVGKTQHAVDHVIIQDNRTHQTTVHGPLGSGSVTYASKAEGLPPTAEDDEDRLH